MRANTLAEDDPSKVGGFDPNTLARAPSHYDRSVDKEFPNLTRFLTGSLFISYSGIDQQRILNQIVEPVICDRFADGYFLHSRKSGGAAQYVRVVHAALCLCDKFMVVIAQNSVKNEWVRSEVLWAIRHRSRIISCLLDNSNPSHLNPSLDVLQHSNMLIDFRDDVSEARKLLAHVLDEWLAVNPYPRFPSGRPGRGG